MREIEAELLARVLQNVQSVQNHNAPSVEIIVSRANTPILRPEYWQESIVTEDATATCTSVAVKKVGHKITDVYVSYVAGGVLTVKKAAFQLPITRIIWTTVETIAGAVECAIEFDGTFITHEKKVEFRTGATPYLFYTTSAGALMYGLLGAETYDTLVASGVGSIDAVMGVESRHGEISQGLIAFYIVAGAVCYRQLVDGVWLGQETVSIAPANAVSIKVERLFDYRIVLHVTDNTGALHEVFSKMEASGWICQEFITAKLTQSNELIALVYFYEQEVEYITAQLTQENEVLYVLSPVMVSAVNIDNGSGDYGYKVRVTFDERIFDVDTGFVLTDAGSGAWPCVSATKVGDKVVEIEFGNFNNASGDCTVAYTPGFMMGDVVAVDADSVTFTPTGLVPYAEFPPVPTGVSNIQDWSGSL